MPQRAEPFRDEPGRTEHHARLQYVLIGEGGKTCGACGPRRAFKRIGAAEVGLSHALVVGHGTGLWLGPGPVHALRHIDWEAEPHLTLARMSCLMPGSLVLRNALGEF